MALELVGARRCAVVASVTSDDLVNVAVGLAASDVQPGVFGSTCDSVMVASRQKPNLTAHLSGYGAQVEVNSRRGLRIFGAHRGARTLVRKNSLA